MKIDPRALHLTTDGNLIPENEKYSTHMENKMRGEAFMSLRTHYYSTKPDSEGNVYPSGARIIDSNGNSRIYESVNNRKTIPLIQIPNANK